MLLLAAFLGCLCVVQTSAQDPDDLLAIEQLADKNYISRYNSWGELSWIRYVKFTIHFQNIPTICCLLRVSVDRSIPKRKNPRVYR